MVPKKCVGELADSAVRVSQAGVGTRRSVGPLVWKVGLVPEDGVIHFSKRVFANRGVNSGCFRHPLRPCAIARLRASPPTPPRPLFECAGHDAEETNTEIRDNLVDGSFIRAGSMSPSWRPIEVALSTSGPVKKNGE